jgi:hypothetical protein
MTDRHASRTAVLSSPDLMPRVISFLVGGQKEARENVGAAASACRFWRDVAMGNEVWERVASEVMPAMRERISEVGARRWMLERGKCHHDQKAWVGWMCDIELQLQVEVWDRFTERCLLSATGELVISDNPPKISIDRGREGRCEVVGPAFSAASVDPVQRRLASIDDYFRRAGGQGPDHKPIIIRVYVVDPWRGRQALLWDTNCEPDLSSCPRAAA